MHLSEYIINERVISDMPHLNKDEVLKVLIEAAVRPDTVIDQQKIFSILQEREKLGSTGLADGIAIPHGKCAECKSVLISVGRSKNGIEFGAFDGKPSHIFFLVLAPKTAMARHLSILGHIADTFKKPAMRTAFMNAKNSDALLELLMEL